MSQVDGRGYFLPQDDEVLDEPRLRQALEDIQLRLDEQMATLQIAARSWLSGDLRASAAATVADGWLVCDGSSVLRATYPSLFTALGGAASPYGLPDGTHFNLPDLRGRIPVGAGTGTGLTARARGALGGNERENADLAAHTHTGTTNGADRSLDHLHNPSAGFSNFVGRAVGFGGSGGGNLNDTMAQTGAADRSLDHLHTFTTNSAGAGGGHPNMQPFQVVTWLVKT